MVTICRWCGHLSAVIFNTPSRFLVFKSRFYRDANMTRESLLDLLGGLMRGGVPNSGEDYLTQLEDSIHIGNLTAANLTFFMRNVRNSTLDIRKYLCLALLLSTRRLLRNGIMRLLSNSHQTGSPALLTNASLLRVAKQVGQLFRNIPTGAVQSRVLLCLQLANGSS